MNAVVKYGVGAAVLGVLAVMGNQMSTKERAEAATRFGLDAPGVSIMEACISEMNVRDIKFKSGVDEVPGCACAAREMTDHVDASDMPLAMDLMKAIVRSGDDDSTPAMLYADVGEAADKHGVSLDQVSNVLEPITTGFSYCANPNTHLTELQREEKSKQQQTSADKSREAIEYAVQKGVMTREEADRRLARLQQ